MDARAQSTGRPGRLTLCASRSSRWARARPRLKDPDWAFLPPTLARRLEEARVDNRGAPDGGVTFPWTKGGSGQEVPGGKAFTRE